MAPLGDSRTPSRVRRSDNGPSHFGQIVEDCQPLENFGRKDAISLCIDDAQNGPDHSRLRPIATNRLVIHPRETRQRSHVQHVFQRSMLRTSEFDLGYQPIVPIRCRPGAPGHTLRFTNPDYAIHCTAAERGFGALNGEQPGWQTRHDFDKEEDDVDDLLPQRSRLRIRAAAKQTSRASTCSARGLCLSQQKIRARRLAVRGSLTRNGTATFYACGRY